MRHAVPKETRKERIIRISLETIGCILAGCLLGSLFTWFYFIVLS